MSKRINASEAAIIVFAVFCFCFFGYMIFNQYVKSQLKDKIVADLEKTLETKEPISNSYLEYSWTTSYSENEYEKVASVSTPLKMEIKDVNVTRTIGNGAAQMSKDLVKGVYDGLFKN